MASSLNNASSEQFTVTFADFLGAVSGVSTASFVLATTGSASGSIASVSGSGDIYTVTVNGVTGDGTLGLNLKSSGTGISDAAGNAPTAGFIGQTYTVEHTPPSVSSISTVGINPNNGGTEQFAVAFSEAVTGVTTGDFALTDTGSVTGTIASISGSGSSYTVTVTGATGTGTMRLDLNSSGTGIADAAGNAFSGGFTGGASFAISPASGMPSISAPSAETVGVGQNNQIGSVTILETPTSGGETFALTVSDTNGSLSANTGATNGDGTITPSNGNRTLTITGTLSQVNADLMTLTENEPTTISYALSDSNGGNASPASTTLTVNGVPTISAPASATVAPNSPTPIGTIGISETGNTTTSGETFSIVVSDGAGLLSANTGGNGVSKITATGSGATINAGNGGNTITATGAGDNITTGSGNDSITVTAAAQSSRPFWASTRSGSPVRTTTSSIRAVPTR